MLNIKAMWSRMTSKAGDLNEIYQRRNFIGLCSLYVFYFILFNQPSDKKVRSPLPFAEVSPSCVSIAISRLPRPVVPRMRLG